MKEFFRNTKPFGQLVTLLVAIVILFVIASGILTLAMKCGANVLEPHFLLLFQGLIQLLTFLLPALLFAWLFSDDTARFLCLDFSGRKWTLALMGILILACLLPLSDWLAQINDSWHLPENMRTLEEKLRLQSEKSETLIEQFLSLRGVGNLFLNLIVIALIPAISEEFLFRGVLQQWFERWTKNHHLAILITAAIFSLTHGEIFAFLPRFMLGIMLGYLFHYSKSMLVNVSVHFINNAAIVAINYLYKGGIIENNIADEINAPFYVILIGVLIASVIFYRVFLKNNLEQTKQSVR
mgnify:CR=1 FL=1